MQSAKVCSLGWIVLVLYVPRMPESLIQSTLQTAHDESGHN